jgi:hypothetical protein
MRSPRCRPPKTLLLAAAAALVLAVGVRAAEPDATLVYSSRATDAHRLVIDKKQRAATLTSTDAAGGVTADIVVNPKAITLRRYSGAGDARRVVDTIVLDPSGKQVSRTTQNDRAFDEWAARYVNDVNRIVLPQTTALWGISCEGSCMIKYALCLAAISATGPAAAIAALACYGSVVYCMTECDGGEGGTPGHVPQIPCGSRTCNAQTSQCCEQRLCAPRNGQCP